MKRLVIFDMDGTVLDTIEDLLGAMNHALNKHGYPLHTIPEMKTFVGNGLYQMVVRALPEGASAEVTDAVFADFKGYYREHLNERTRPYDGIVPLLEKLNQLGILCAISSNKFDYGAQLLSRAHFGERIALTVGESETVPKKPDPTGTLLIMKMLGADAEHTLYIGDSGVDLKTAAAAGLECLCVSWGFAGKEKLLAAGAARIADSCGELMNGILRFFGLSL